MSLSEFRAVMADAPDAYSLPLGFDGCPCFRFEVPGLRAWGHCWRSTFDGYVGGCDCEYVGLHYWGDTADGDRLAQLLTAMDWYGEWPSVREGDYPIEPTR